MTKPMNNEPKKPIKADELTEKELDGIVGGKENIGRSEPEITGMMNITVGDDSLSK